jgi:hypothetical protein
MLSDHYLGTGALVRSYELAQQSVLAEAEYSDRGEEYPFLASRYARLGLWKQADDWLDRFERSSHGESDWSRLNRLELLRLEGRGAEMARLLQADLKARGSELPAPAPGYGILQALSGDYGGAIATLAPQLDVDGPLSADMESDDNARHALAWAYFNTGAAARANRILSRLEQAYGERQAQGRLHLSIDLAMFAQNAVLAGDRNLAIDRLTQAVNTGWRDYYSVINDPRWRSLGDDPRFQALMATVKADVDSQRARVEQIESDSRHDFAARLDTVLQSRAIAQRSRP